MLEHCITRKQFLNIDDKCIFYIACKMSGNGENPYIGTLSKFCSATLEKNMFCGFGSQNHFSDTGVEYQSATSGERVYRASLLQGSVLSPALFLLWAAPLATVLKRSPAPRFN